MMGNIIQCNKCKCNIFFDEKVLSPNGKKMPIEIDTHKVHDCPLSEYNIRVKASIHD